MDLGQELWKIKHKLHNLSFFFFVILGLNLHVIDGFRLGVITSVIDDILQSGTL